MKTIFLSLLVLLCTNGFAQDLSVPAPAPPKVTPEVTFANIKSSNFGLGKNVYLWKYDKSSDGVTLKFTVMLGTTEQEFKFYNLNYESFRIDFNKSLSLLDPTVKDKVEVYEEASRIFYILMTLPITNNPDFAPESGRISIKKDTIPVYRFREVSAAKQYLTMVTETRERLRTQKLNLQSDSTSYSNVSLAKSGKTPKDLLDKQTKTNNILTEINDKLIVLDAEYNSARIRQRKERKNIFSNTRMDSLFRFNVDSVSVEFFEGNIKNIIVIGNYTYSKTNPISRHFAFRNYFPIPFSSISHYAKTNVKLWAFPNARDKETSKDSSDYFIYLSDVISYLPSFANNQEDFSPADQAKVFKPDFNVPLFKEVNSKLFRVKVFSDFIGIKDDQPNGLVQTELSKKILLYPGRPVGKKIKRSRVFVGALNYIEPVFTFSKIEENNKYLTLQPVTEKECNCKSGEKILGRTNILNIYKYQNVSVGSTVNLVVADIPLLKSSFYFNLGFKVLRTGISDTLRTWNNGKITTATTINKFNVNSIQLFPELLYQVKPDTRFGFTVGTKFSYLLVQNNNLTPTLKDDDYVNMTETRLRKRGIFTLQVDAFLRPNPSQSKNGEIFLRVNYNQLLANKNQNFMQFQLGYAFSILKHEETKVRQ